MRQEVVPTIEVPLPPPVAVAPIVRHQGVAAVHQVAQGAPLQAQDVQ